MPIFSENHRALLRRSEIDCTHIQYLLRYAYGSSHTRRIRETALKSSLKKYKYILSLLFWSLDNAQEGYLGS